MVLLPSRRKTDSNGLKDVSTIYCTLLMLSHVGPRFLRESRYRARSRQIVSCTSDWHWLCRGKPRKVQSHALSSTCFHFDCRKLTVCVELWLTCRQIQYHFEFEVENAGQTTTLKKDFRATTFDDMYRAFFARPPKLRG